MKKSFKLFAALLLAGGFALSLSSCKDSEDVAGGPTPEEMAQSKESDSAKGLLSVLSFTSQLDSLPDNWYSNSYTVEPTVGTVNDQSTPFVRYIPVLNKEEAIAKYNSIANELMPEGSTSATFNIENVGFVKFNVLDQTDCTATLDINIKQQPHLTQIRFVPVSAMGENAKLDGEPYYNFGDIIELNENDIRTYWICVRPCSQKEKKSTSHWMSFNLISWNVKDINNLKKITKSDCEDYFLPTQLGDKSGSREHLQNLFKLLYILDNPENYDIYAKYDGGLGGISKEEFTKDDVKKISEIWEAKNYWKRVLPENMQRTTLTSCFGGADAEVNVFYYGYHYSSFLSTTASVYKAKLTRNNLRLAEDGEIKWKRSEKPVDFSCYAYTGIKDAFVDPAVGLPEKGFIVRYKTGRQLIGGGSGNDEDPTHSFMAKHDKKIKDICVYRDVKKYLTIGASLVGDLITNEDPSTPSTKNISWYCALGYANGNPTDLGHYAYYFKFKNTSENTKKLTLQNLRPTTLAYVNLLNAILYAEYPKESGLDGNALSAEYKSALEILAMSIKNDYKMGRKKLSLEDVLSLNLLDADGKKFSKDKKGSELTTVTLKMPYVDAETADGHYKMATLRYDVQNRKFEVWPQTTDAEPITSGLSLFELGKFEDVGDTPTIEDYLQFRPGLEEMGTLSRETAKTKAAEYIKKVADNISGI